MHIPDGFLDLQTAAVAAVVAGLGIAVALRDVKRNLPPRRVPLIGLAAAFVFAAQMLNFPVAAGTSGHLIGAVLACVLVGPAAAVVVMTAVLVLQCLMFADGGVTALGANLLNMAVIAPAVGHVVYSTLKGSTGGLRRTLLAAGFAAWCATLVASLACAAQLAASGTVPWSLVLPAMGGVHMVIGLGEAVITMLVLAVVARARPELLRAGEPAAAAINSTTAFGLLAALGLVAFVAPFASSMPDGLEHVAEKLGFAASATAAHAAPLPDYAVMSLAGDSPLLSTVLAGGIGTLVAFAVAWFVARALTPAHA
jgi:ABC-type Co2+ transport system, permease component